MDVTLLPGFDAQGDVDQRTARRVAQAWLAGGIVGLPTETVYGLAADAQDPEAVARIYRAKGRPADHPLIVHVVGPEALLGWSADASPAAARLAEAFWPGPLTVVVRRGPRAGDFVTGGQDTVALRCPGHPVARACIRALAELSGDAARGVAAPSANRFGRVSPTRAQDVVAEVGDRLDPRRDLLVDGGPCAVGVESTIVDCTVDPPRVLRLGAISQAQVDAALAERSTAGPTAPPAKPAVAPVDAGGEGAPTDQVRAPGTLQSHYAPHARVLLIEPSIDGESHLVDRTARIESTELSATALDQPTEGVGTGLIAARAVRTPAGWVRLLAAEDAESYARDLYAALRQADELGLRRVVAVLPHPDGGPLATAVRDRLARAAHRD